MIRYNKTKVIRITETQHNTLVKMKSYNVNVGDFIRNAIKEKIEREYDYMIDKKKEIEDPFLHSLNIALEEILKQPHSN
ncbi:hypothetical protein AVT42_gp34 [Polaribacter phage P12002S]|uniref:Uncharacterized protein n=1 Tax=Polaribacter phage P12002S TaxID=1647387 RepID=A0A0F7ILK0_9CAUD|nr:hypothetical protein AVT42_gp34 [Polaribacter phage P12002S]AKG94290.1 hypothetical protein P12002S_0034 [Polaribacter phage P12002S]